MRKALFMILVILPSLVIGQVVKIGSSVGQVTVPLLSKGSDVVAQEGYKGADQKYLKGAVTEENERVVFRYTVPLIQFSSHEALERLRTWKGWGTHNTAKIKELYVSPERGEVALLVEDHLKFMPSVAYVEESDVSFNILFKVYSDRCEITIQNIKYNYTEAHKRIEEKAEGMITDKVALEKDGRLARYYDKFRYHTLDLIWDIENSLQTYIGVERLVDLKTFTNTEVIPANITKILEADLTLLTYTDGAIHSLRVNEGILKNVDGKVLLNLACNSQMKQGDVFSLSFYNETYRAKLDELDLSMVATPEGGIAYSEAWMIVACRMTESGMQDQVVGEVLSVWSK